MILNCHSHLNYRPDTKQLVISDMPVEDYLEHCAARGVTRSVLTAGLGLPTDNPNGMTLEMAQRYPDFFLPLAMIRVGKDDPELVTHYHGRGFVGLKIINPAYPYDDPRAYEYYRRAERLRMPILFHTGWVAYNDASRLEYVNCEFMRPIRLDTICRNFPELDCIGAHLGNYCWEEAIGIVTRHPNLYFDITGGIIRRKSLRFFREAFSRGAKQSLESEEEALDLAPFDKFVYGSDNATPELFLTFYGNLMRLLGVPKETQKKVYWGNAAKIFHLDTP